MAATGVPAWKRLGLKLKQPASEAPNDSAGSGAVGHPSSSSAAQSSPKRKQVDPPGGSQLNPIHGNKRPRRDVSPKPKPGTKKVTFGDTPSNRDVVGDGSSKRASNEPTKQQQPKKKSAKSPTKKQQQAATSSASIADIKPALEYLQLWKTSRESWKFNKNHQSSLIRHIFDDVFPSSHVDSFYEYIRDLKGFIRTRLRETAMEVRERDESGYAAFPEGTTDVDEKQTTYDSVLAGILRRRQAGKRKFFDEPRYVAESEDGDVILRRLIKRMRAELVIEELSDSEESTGTVTTSTSSKTVTASDNNATVTTDQDKQVALNPSNNTTTSRRRRKLRVNMDDSSSSESEAESESETSSSSEDESDSDEEERPDEDDTSSSSSSSSSEAESDSDETGDEE